MGDKKNQKGEWTSLEVGKLAVPVLASIVMVGVGWYIGDKSEEFKSTLQKREDIFTKALERDEKSIDSLVATRLRLYDQIGQKLNRLLSYYMYRGRWKEFSPDDIVEYKRELDEIVYTYQPFFSPKFLTAFNTFEDQLFKPYTGWGKDAQLRTRVEHRAEFYLPMDKTKTWKPEWNEHFTGENNTEAIRTAYSTLMSQLPTELGLPKARNLSAEELPQAHLPDDDKGK